MLGLYIGSSLFGLASYHIAQTLKYKETRPRNLWRQRHARQQVRRYEPRFAPSSIHATSDLRASLPERVRFVPLSASSNIGERSEDERLKADPSDAGGRVQVDEVYSPHNISSAESGQAAFSTAAEKHKADTPLELDANASTKPDVPPRDPLDTLLQPNSHIQVKFRPEDARALPMPYSKDVRSTLRALLKAQEDSLCATKQLLAMCSASAEPDRVLTTLHTRSTNVSVDSLYSNEHR